LGEELSPLCEEGALEYGSSLKTRKPSKTYPKSKRPKTMNMAFGYIGRIQVVGGCAPTSYELDDEKNSKYRKLRRTPTSFHYMALAKWRHGCAYLE